MASSEAESGATPSLWTIEAGDVIELPKANGGVCRIVASCHSATAVFRTIRSEVTADGVDNVALELDDERINAMFPGQKPEPSRPRVTQTPTLLIGGALEEMCSAPLVRADAGAEQTDMSWAVSVAEAAGVPMELVDRPISVTLARVRALDVLMHELNVDCDSYARLIEAVWNSDRKALAAAIREGVASDPAAEAVTARALEIERTISEGIVDTGMAKGQAMSKALRLTEAAKRMMLALADVVEGHTATEEHLRHMREGTVLAAQLGLLAGEVRRGCDLQLATGEMLPSESIANGVAYAPASSGQLLFKPVTAASVRRSPRWPADDVVLGGLAGDVALVDERDYVLAHRLYELPGQTTVAVVGMGHVPGIARRWGSTEEQVAAALQLPPTDYVTHDWLGPAAGCLAGGVVAAAAWQSGRVGKAAVVVSSLGLMTAIGAVGTFLSRAAAMSAQISAEVASAKRALEQPKQAAAEA